MCAEYGYMRRRCETDKDERVRVKGMMKETQAEMCCFQSHSEREKKRDWFPKKPLIHDVLAPINHGKVNILLWLEAVLSKNLNPRYNSHMAESPRDTAARW